MKFWQQTATWPEIDLSLRGAFAGRAGVLRDVWRKIQREAAGLPFAEDLLAAYYCALDRRTPFHVKAALVAALGYFVVPTDVIPDYIPVVGYMDDAAVLAAAVKLFSRHIKAEHREAARQMLARLRAEA